MILYKVIKYTILEKCLDVLFTTLFENINAFKKIHSKDLYPGQLLSKIKYLDAIFNDCEIIVSRPSVNSNALTFIKFSYKSILNSHIIAHHGGVLHIVPESQICSVLCIIDNGHLSGYPNHAFEFIP